jgi:outer membrane protein TolC
MATESVRAALDLLAALERKGLRFRVHDGRLLASSARDLTPADLAALATHRAALLSLVGATPTTRLAELAAEAASVFGDRLAEPMPGREHWREETEEEPT